MAKTKLSNKGQIVIPKQVRTAHGWEPGLEFVIEDTGDRIKKRPCGKFWVALITRAPGSR